LSKYIWELKNKNTYFNITWKIMKKTNSYNKVTKRCNLCLWEKYFIVYQPSEASLNNVRSGNIQYYIFCRVDTAQQLDVFTE